MRCPKCHYISFDSGDRCRNCGYEFSLSVDLAALDLPIQTGDEPVGPLADLRLGERDTAEARAARAVPQLSAFDAAVAQPSGEQAPLRRAVESGLDLPLFTRGVPDDDRPLVTPPAVPRAPLAVRRGSPAAGRPRARAAAEPEEPVLALDLEEEAPRASIQAESPRAHVRHAALAVSSTGDYVTASPVRRACAGAIDAAIIVGIDAAVLYFTLQLSGLRWREVSLLPPVPFLTFILLLNGGYFASFVAAGGQTIGKMAAGVRVIPHPFEGDARVSFGYAVLRAAAYLVSVLPLGLGLLPAFFSAERRTLHDRLAETRVVRTGN